MPKIKVLHYLRNLGLGGTEKTCQLFFEHANKDLFEVHLAHEKIGDNTRLEEFEKGSHVCDGQLWTVDSRGTTRDALQILINELKIDIVHVYRSGFHEFPAPGFDINVRGFVTTNVFGFYDANPKISRDLFMSKWLMDRTVSKLGFKPDRFDFVNNPVEEPYTDQSLEIALRWREDGAIIAGRCGRPDNGIYNAVSLDAIRLLRMQGYDIRFIAVAPPPNMVKDLIDFDIPFFMFNPTTDPLVLSTFYNSVDIYTHARADGETFGVNIAEAMMHGKPTITHIATPSVPGMGVFQAQTELIDNGINGFVVNNNPAEYAEALKHLIDDKPLRLKMGESARQKAMAEYHVNVCVSKLERIYQEIIK